MADQTLQLEVKLENGQFKVNAKEVEKSLGGIGEKTSGLSKVMGAIGGMISGAAFLKLAKSAMTASAELEKQKIILTTLTGSAQKADKVLSDMKAFAAGTPFELSGLVETSKKLMAAGVTGDELVGVMKRLGDVSMGNQSQFEGLAETYAKAMTKGKISVEELNQFTEKGINITGELAEKYNTTTGMIKYMAEKGRIGFTDVNDALTRLTTGTGKYAGTLDAMSMTTGGMFQRLKNQMTGVVTTMGDQMGPGVRNLVNAFLDAVPGTGTFGKALGGIGMILGKVAGAIAVVINTVGLLMIKLQKFGGSAEEQTAALQITFNMLKQGYLSTEKYFESAKTGNVQAMQDLLMWNKVKIKGDEERKKLTTEKIAMNKKLDESIKGLVSSQDDINKTTLKAKDIKDAKNRQKELSEEDKYVLQRQELMGRYYDDQAEREDILQEYKQGKQLEAANYEYQLLQSKLGLNTRYAQGLNDVFAAGQVFMNEKNIHLFRFGQVLASGQAIMNTAMGVTKTLAMFGMPWAIPFMAITAAAGALQIKQIWSQKPPKPPPMETKTVPTPSLAVGTMNVPMDTPAFLHAGEMVVPKAMSESIRSGDASLSGGAGLNLNMVVDSQVLGSVVDDRRNKTARRMGARNYSLQGAYI